MSEMARMMRWIKEIELSIALSLQIKPEEMYGYSPAGEDAEENFSEADDFSDE
jgi:hypothetical protein